jgi:SAM-dependent methyltransferase
MHMQVTERLSPEQLARLRAELQERQTRPLYVNVVDDLGLRRGARILGSGCGAGTALRVAADRGADVYGIDRSPELLAVARAAVPGADLRLCEQSALPFDNDLFDAAMAYTRLQFAPEPADGLSEMVRVTRPGGLVAAGLWDIGANPVARAFVGALQTVLLPTAALRNSGLMLGDRRRLHQLMVGAGLEIHAGGTVTCPFAFPDLDTTWQAMLTCAPVARAVEMAGEALVRSVFDVHTVPYCAFDGSFSYTNTYHYVIGRVPPVR